MSDVPSNLIPTRITQLPTAPVASEDSLMMIVYNGNNYQIRVGDLLSVAGVPTTRQVIAGTSLTGGGQLSSNVTLSVATGGITSTQLSATGVAAGSYGDATNIPVFTVDSTGRVTAASTIAATISGYVPTTRQVIAGTGLTGGGPLNANVTLAADLSDSLPLAGLTTGSSGVATSISRSDHKHPQVDLSSANEVENILGLSNGGTARSLTPNAGAIIWSGADGLYVGPPGSAGQVLVSGGTAAPTWGSALVVSNQDANVVYAGPTSGAAAPTAFRALVNADLPVSGVTANTYGSSTTVPVITVNSKGIVTSVTTSSIIGTLSYQGGWNASTNTPALTSSVGTGGYYYVVTTAGTTDLNGITDWQIGDWAIFNGTVWQKIDQTNTVTSVNGQTGAVSVGTVTSVAMTVPTGLSISGTPITTSGTLALTFASGYSIPTDANQTNWTTAYTQTQQWNGGSTNLVSATGRTSLGGTTVGQSMFTLTNPSAITFPQFNADNTVSALDAASFRTAIGAGTGGGDVTGPSSSTDNAVARFDLTTGKIIQNSTVTIDDSGVVSSSKELIGPAASANLTRFPNALGVVSNTAAGIQQNESMYIGWMAEAVSVSTTWGSGLYGAGYTNATGNGRGTGVTGEGHVSSETDTGVCVGVRGYANDTHSGNYNIGLYGDASNGSFATYGGNVALFLANGNIVTSSASAKTWYMGGDITFDGQGSAKVVSATNGAVINATTATTAAGLSATLAIGSGGTGTTHGTDGGTF
jgi:hypothetical protein